MIEHMLNCLVHGDLNYTITAFFPDPFVVSLVQDIVKVLAANPACTSAVQTRFIPPLNSILNSDSEKLSPGLVSVSTVFSLIDLLVDNFSTFYAFLHCSLMYYILSQHPSQSSNVLDSMTSAQGISCLKRICVRYYDKHPRDIMLDEGTQYQIA